MTKNFTRITLCFIVVFAVLFSCTCPSFGTATEDDIEDRTWVRGDGEIIILPDLDLTTTTVARPPVGSTNQTDSSEGSASPYVIIDGDNRRQILDSDVYPNSPIVFLELHHETETQYGTGFFVAPNVIVTAAHNVNDYGNEVSYVTVMPGGEDNTIAVFSLFYSQSVYVPYQWITQYNQDYDFAILYLNSSTSSQLSDLVGSLTLASYTDSQLANLSINAKGFPGDKVLGTLWGGNGTIISYYNNQVHFNADIHRGQSGGPLVLATDHTKVIGLINFESDDQYNDENDYNYGVRVTSTLVNMVELAANNGLGVLP